MTSRPESGSPTRHQPHKRHETWLVFLCALGLFYVHFAPKVEVDCIVAPYAAWSLVRTASFDVGKYEYLEKFRGGALIRNDAGQWLSKYPPGSTIAAVPFVLPVALFREQPLRSDYMRRLGKLSAACSVAGAVAIFYLLCSQLVPSAAKLATVLLAAGTCLWPVASQGLWAHGPATFWVTLGLYLLLKQSSLTPSSALLAGLALGAAALTRPTTILFAGATAVVLAYKEGWRPTLTCVMGLAPPLLLLLFYNSFYFGVAVAGGYGGEVARWDHPFWHGFAGLLANPSRGLFVYTPAFLLVPLGVRHLAGRQGGDTQRALMFGWLAAAIATVALYANWHVWWGAWCFGPRFLSECFPVLCLIFAFSVDRLRGRWGQSLAKGLVAISVLIHILGVFGEDDGAWNLRHVNGPEFTFHDTQIEAVGRHLIGRIRGE